MTWTIDPRRFGARVREDHRDLCRAVALEVDRRLVMGTPVDTGRARGNWLPSIADPRADQVEARSAEAAVAEAASVISNSPDFPVIFLSNNLPYIKRLNEGHSQQAPAGFVEAAIDSVVANANRAIP